MALTEIKAVVLTVATSDIELASDALWSLGVVAIEERRISGNSTVCELWTSLGDDSAEIVAALQDVHRRWPMRFEFVDPGVSETWRAFAEPTIVDRDVVVYPAWKARPETSAAYVIAIEPGATFGMGDHPTTGACIRAMKRIIEQAPGGSMLDVGCGSGVLAVAACLFGAAQADGIDISPACVPTTEENARLNGVATKVRASTTALRDLPGPYDLVVANILAPTLMELAPGLQRVLSPTGILIVSGILADNHAHVLHALAPLVVIANDVQDVWSAITLAAR